MARKDVIVEEGDGFQRFVIDCATSRSVSKRRHSADLLRRLERQNKRWLQQFRFIQASKGVSGEKQG